MLPREHSSFCTDIPTPKDNVFRLLRTLLPKSRYGLAGMLAKLNMGWYTDAMLSDELLCSATRELIEVRWYGEAVSSAHYTR
jgi:hypothetical protein